MGSTLKKISHRQLITAEQSISTINCRRVSFLSISKVGTITFLSYAPFEREKENIMPRPEKVIWVGSQKEKPSTKDFALFTLRIAPLHPKNIKIFSVVNCCRRYFNIFGMWESIFFFFFIIDEQNPSSINVPKMGLSDSLGYGHVQKATIMLLKNCSSTICFLLIPAKKYTCVS